MLNVTHWFKLPALCFFGLSLIFIAPRALAQEYLVSIQHYSVPEGLSDRYVRHAVQDRRGFIWAATYNGINRFDGFEFQQYTREKDGLSSASCHKILEGRQGRLWLFYTPPPAAEGELRGFFLIDLFDPATGLATPFEKAFEAPFAEADITEVQSGHLGNIYFLLRSGEIYRYDGAAFRRLFKIPFAGAGRLAVSGEGLIGLLNRDSVIQFDSLGRVLHRVPLPAACDFIRAANGRFWVGKSKPEGGPALWSIRAGEPAQRIYLRDANGNLLNFTWDSNFLAPFNPDHLGRLWAFLGGRLLLFGPDGQFLYDFSAGLKPFALPYPAFIYLDRCNTAWIGSTHGLLSVTIRKNPFDNYLQSEELVDTRGIAQDEKGRVYVLQQGNTWLLDPASGAAANLGIPAWTAAARDAAGRLWFGDYSFIVHFYDPVSGEKKTFYPAGPKGTGQYSATFALFPDSSSGRIWIGTNGRGLAYIDSPYQAITLFTGYNQFQHLQKASVKYFLKDKQRLWMGTDLGLYQLEPGKGVIAEHSRRAGSLPFDDINHVYKDKEGIFWLATKGGGLIRWDREAGNFRQFTQRDGLSNDVVHAVYEDESGQLWLPSDYGLMRFDKHSFQVNTYLPRDGLPHEEFNYCSHYQAADGRLFFGGLNGVTAFYPHELYRENLEDSPIPGISQYLELDGNTGAFIDKTQDLLATDGIQLPPRNKSLLLKIAFPDYQSPKDNRFAYRIAGLHEAWIYQPDNTIRINGLPYGSFTLQVKAQGTNGLWSARVLNLPLTVLRPFYLRWWFLILGIALVFLIIFWRIQTLRQAARKLEAEVQKRTSQIEKDKKVIEKQAAELRELDELKSRFFTNVAHELRTPLTLILGPLQHALEKPGLDKKLATMLDLARGNTKSLLRLVEELLNLKKLEAGNLTLQEQSVEFYPLVRRLVSNFESVADANGIRMHLHYQEGRELWLALDATKFERIILNLLSNALKFTPAGGLVEVKAADTDSQIQITVTDTGRGIPPEDLPYIFDRFYQVSPQRQAEGGAGIGLALSREYAQLMNGRLSAKSEPGIGSTFILELPKKEVFGEFRSSELGATRPVPTLRPGSISEMKELQKPNAENRPQILIVEDNSDMRRFLWEILSPHYHVVTAPNGKAALELLQKQTVDIPSEALAKVQLILTDIMMPEMDGFTLIRRLKSSPEWQGIPVIALTARAGLDDRLSALRFGVDDYLAKPFEPVELFARIANLLKNYRQRQEWLAARQTAGEKNAYYLKIDPPETILPADQQWLAELEAIALQKIGSADFSVTELAYQLHLSERNLRRKLKELTGLSPGDYLNEIRLQRARQFLDSGTYKTVAEVSYAIGLSTPKHFSRLFKARFGKVPSSYF